MPQLNGVHKASFHFWLPDNTTGNQSPTLHVEKMFHKENGGSLCGEMENKTGLKNYRTVLSTVALNEFERC
jgi:hypothetical protein